MSPRGRHLILGVVVCFGCASARQHTTLERRQADLQQQVTALQGKVGELEGKVATLSKRLQAARQAKAPTNGDRLEPTPTASASPPADATATEARGDATPGSPRPTKVPTAATPMPELDLDALRRESSRQLPPRYERGLELLRAGQYEESIRVMRDFMRAKHTSPFVGGALYWVGQAYLQLGQFYQAILAFTDVQQRFPNGEYAAAAGYASGIGFQALGNTSEARRAFETVVADHPTAPEATKARTRLATLDRRR